MLAVHQMTNSISSPIIWATLTGIAPVGKTLGLFGGQILPSSPVSLAEMAMRFQVSRFGEMLIKIDKFLCILEANNEHGEEDKDAIIRLGAECIKEAKRACLDLNLAATPHQLEQLMFHMERGIEGKQLWTLFVNMQDTLVSEISEHLFIYIDRAEAPLYSDVQFSEGAKSRFPVNLKKDMLFAGRCFSIQDYDGCVLHLMRVIDWGLERVASKFKVPFEKNWQNVINDIRREIKNIDNKHPRLKKDKVFYLDAVDRMEVFKDAYRNNAMHRKVYYGREDAIRMYNSVQFFMEHLAKKLFPKPRKGANGQLGAG